MSLINDALKKAKQAQAKAPVRESAPQLRSPETDHPVRSGSSVMIPAMVIAIGLLGGAAVWIKFRAPQASPPPGSTTLNSTAVPLPPPAPAVTAAIPTPPAVEPAAPSPAIAEVKSPESSSAPKLESAPAAPMALAPAAPRLNGIFFNPARPTAIVNQKLVAVGSRVGEFTVLAITQTGVTLAGDGQTNVLSLSE